MGLNASTFLYFYNEGMEKHVFKLTCVKKHGEYQPINYGFLIANKNSSKKNR